MVKPITPIKREHFLRKEAVLAITALVIVFSFYASFSFAAKTKINAQEVERIQNALDIVKTASNLGSVLVDGGSLMKVLNTAIRGGQTATDVTYGLLVLTAINEMEFMDLVLSQEYGDIAEEYFNDVLDERTSLRSYWKGVGFDIPRVVSGKIASPIGALTLNSFAITDKAIHIFATFNVLQKKKLYDGIWRYFDERMHGESHQGAWELAEPQMGWASKGTNFWGTKENRDEKIIELEQQFAALYEKWGPYATPYGISEEYKKQAKEELRNTLAAAIEQNKDSFAKKEQKLSLWDKFSAQLESIKNNITNLVSQINPFSAGPIIVELPADMDIPAEKSAENGSPLTEEVADVGSPPISESVKLSLTEEAEAAEAPGVDVPGADVGFPPISEEAEIAPVPEPPPVLEPATEPLPATETVEELKIELIPPAEPEVIQEGPKFCQRADSGTPKQYRVLINEVAWMGNQDSPNNEWMELKNVWGIPVNLNGWQLQDKGRQIKMIFGESDVIPAGGYYLLERTDDNSLPDAPADKIYTGALGNSNEALYLFDNQCQLEDEVLANPDWPSGDNLSKKSMQRFDILYWYESSASAGGENSSPPVILAHPSAPTPPPAPTAPAKPSYPKILITETRIESEDNPKEDFVELYNPNDGNIDLTGWYIQRKTETGQDFSSYVPADLLSGKAILAKNYFLIANASSSLAASADAVTSYPLTENNTLVLKNPNQDITDEVFTGSPSEDQSYGRVWSDGEQRYLDEFENQTPTPRAQNAGSGEDGDEEDAGAEPLAVVFSEIAWMGTKASSNDEWMELYNNTENDVDLAGWKIKQDYDDWIELSGIIPASDYFLLERTNDNTVSGITATQIYTGALSNNGAVLELVDGQGNSIDMVDAGDGWFAGDNSAKLTMERINPSNESAPDNWASNNGITRNGLDAEDNPINGTPKAENSVSKEFTEVFGDRIFNEDFTLTRFGSPYIWQGSIIVGAGAKFTVESGVEIRFKHGALSQHAQLKVRGSLEAEGAVFTSYREDQPWDGIYFENSPSSTLDNVTVRYGGFLHQPCCYEFVPFTYGAVYVDGGNVTIKNSLIEKSDTFGVWLKNSDSSQIINTEFRDNLGSDHNSKSAVVLIESGSPAIKDSVLENNLVGILAENNSAPAIENNRFSQNTVPIQISSLLADIKDNIFENNDINGVLVRGFGFSSQQDKITWREMSAPYFIDAALSVPAGRTLEIEPGVEIRLKGNGQINVDGKLEAKGTSQKKIIFAGASGVPGAWRYIRFSASSTDSILEHVSISHGGWWGYTSDNRYGALRIDGLNLIIKDSLFENNRAAIELINGGLASQSKDVVIQNNEIGIYVRAGGNPDLSDVIFVSGEDANNYDIYP